MPNEAGISEDLQSERPVGSIFGLSGHQAAAKPRKPWGALIPALQVLDDSTDEVTRDLVDDKADECREKGVCIQVIRRTNRKGYKAGALKDVRQTST